MQKKVEPPKPSEPSIFLDDDMVIISSVKPSSDSCPDTLVNSRYVY